MQIQTHAIIEASLTLRCVATAEQATDMAMQMGRICMIERADWDGVDKVIVRLIPHNGMDIVGGSP